MNVIAGRRRLAAPGRQQVRNQHRGLLANGGAGLSRRQGGGSVFLVVLLAALVGTWTYSVLRDKLLY